jgi:hypothetical protein
LYVLSETKARELYFQDPGFAFAVLRIITVRLLENAERYRAGGAGASAAGGGAS